MHVAARVRELNGEMKRASHVDTTALRRLEDLSDGPSHEQVHDDVHHPALILPRLEHADDVGVLELGIKPTLLPKAQGEIASLIVHHLDRDEVARVDLDGRPDLTHLALAQLDLEAVIAVQKQIALVEGYLSCGRGRHKTLSQWSATTKSAEESTALASTMAT